MNFATSVMEKAKQHTKRRRQSNVASRYRSLNHLLPTSNIVERLFSRAKLVMTDQRKSMTPYHLECVLFLRCNYFLWNPSTVDEMLRDGDIRITSVASSK